MSNLYSASTAAALEYPLLLDLLGGLAATDVGRKRVERMEPAVELSELQSRRARFLEVEALLSDAALVGFHEESLQDPVDLLSSKSAACSGQHLLVIAEFIQIANRARQRIFSAPGQYPELELRLRAVPDLGILKSRIADSLDHRGEVADQATPLLTRLRRNIRNERSALYADLESVVQEHRIHFSEDTVSLEGGRMVLLLQAGSRDKVDGLVHGKSATGKSFYFEPLEVVGRNNRLQEMTADTAAEKRRILNELLTLAQSDLGALKANLEFVAELDYLQVLVRFGELSVGRLAEIGERHDLQLVEARHPLLDPKLAELRREILGQAGHRETICPLDLGLSADERILVISGPNAGGKTVALKTVGMLVLLSQCGIPVPAGAGTRIPFFDRIEASIGDEQDLLNDRSTFSGRLSNLKNAWNVSENGLVLIDELGSGTDPEEGAALAVALLEGLLAKRPLAVMTTHLTRLAAAAAQQAGAVCAAMQFDSKTGSPTYRLERGSPGGSHALALARRLGLPAEWLDRAESILGPGHSDLRQLLRDVDKRKRALDVERAEAATELRRAVQDREELVSAQHALELEKISIAREMRRELDDLRLRTRTRLNEEIVRLRAEIVPAKKARTLAKSLGRIFDSDTRAKLETEVTSKAVEREIVLRSRVRHHALGWEGIVEKLDRDRVEVSVRGKRLKCGIDDLTAVQEQSSNQNSQKGANRHQSQRQDQEDSETELNLIGWRVEPALEALERFVDRALLADDDRIRVVHGHGTGALRDALRRMLKEHPAVGSIRAGSSKEGGDGATVVRLRG